MVRYTFRNPLDLFFLAAVFVTMVGPASASPRLSCSSPNTQSEMNDCAHLEQKAADLQLAMEWKRAQAWARNQDKDLDRTYDKRPSYSSKLLEAQRAWISYKDAHCDIKAWFARGGSMEPMIFSTCVATITRERVGELSRMISQ